MKEILILEIILIISSLAVGSFVGCWLSRFNEQPRGKIIESSTRSLNENTHQESFDTRALDKMSERSIWSRCDTCGKKLTLAENIPVISFVMQRGKCRSCGSAIWLGHTVSEVMTLLAMVALIITLNDSVLRVFWFVTIVVLGVIVYLDKKFLMIPDDLILYLLLLGLISWRLNLGSLKGVEIVWALLIGFLILEVPRYIFLKMRGEEGMGGADPRLSMACASFVEFYLVPFAVFCASLLGILFFIIRAKKAGAASLRSRIPFGPFLIFGYVVIFIGQDFI